MAGTGNSRAAFRKAYKHGDISIEHVGSSLIITGRTYDGRLAIKEMGGIWDKGNKAWVVDVDEMPESALGLLHDLTGEDGSDLIQWLGYVDGASTYKWLR